MHRGTTQAGSAPLISSGQQAAKAAVASTGSPSPDFGQGSESTGYLLVLPHPAHWGTPTCQDHCLLVPAGL